jgi:hypothetical protein
MPKRISGRATAAIGGQSVSIEDILRVLVRQLAKSIFQRAPQLAAQWAFELAQSLHSASFV